MKSVFSFKFPALIGVLIAGAAVSAVPARAAVFEASTSFTLNQPFPSPYYVSLPKYVGGGTVTGVVLSVSGSAGGVDYFPYDPTVGIAVASFPTSWDVQLYGPTDAFGNGPLVVDAPIVTEFVGGSIPPCAACGGIAYAYFGPTTQAYSGAAPVTDLADFKGLGDNQFFVVDNSYFDNNSLAATVTETLSISTPEPSIWAMMVVGLALVGFAARRRPRAAPPTDVAAAGSSGF